MNWGRLIHRYGQLNRTIDAQNHAQEHPQDVARILHDHGDPDGAMAWHKEAERLCRELGDKVGLAHALGSQALIFQECGDLESAAALHKEAQHFYHQLGNREGIAASLDHRANIVQRRADFDGAMALYEEAECLYREPGSRDEVALPLHDQARILKEERDLDRTLDLVALILFAYVAEARQLRFAPFNSSGIYGLGERAGWTVSLAQGTPAAARKYTYEIKSNNLNTIKSGTLEFKSGSATIEATLEEPAMLYVTVTAEGAPRASAIHLGAAFAPTQLRPSAARPPDFDAFWDAKLHELSQTPLNPVATLATCNDGVELSTVQVDGWGSRTHGYLAKPARAGKFPALVIFRYAGAYDMRPHAAIHRAAEGWLAFDVVSHDLPPDKAGGANPNYEAIGNTNRETSYFLKMYLRDARAVDYIASRPDWDGKTLVLMGTCMGGQQALATAGLRPQVTAVIVHQPSGADSNGEVAGRKTGYPYWPSDDPRVMATALYFDTVNFAPRIKAPVLASIGFVDTTSPPAGIWTMLNQIPSPREVVTMIDLDHTNRTPDKQGAFRSRAAEVFDILLHGGQFKPNQ
jgi:cephalosporin-C deacetylase-like acetyl esterase/tetratricopeptide (TPR) repeat protein